MLSLILSQNSCHSLAYTVVLQGSAGISLDQILDSLDKRMDIRIDVFSLIRSLTVLRETGSGRQNREQIKLLV